VRTPAIVSALTLLCACGTPREAKAPPPPSTATAPAAAQAEPAGDREAAPPPSPTPAAAAAPGSPAPIAESAIVASSDGLVLVDVPSGDTSVVWKGAVQACLADPAARAIWFLGRTSGETALYAHDLATGGEPAVIASGVPAEAEAIAVTSWRGGNLESASITSFQLGLLLDVRSTPRIQRFVGCMSDAFDCFAEVESETLRPELEQIAARIDTLSVSDPGTAKRLGDRSAGAVRPTLPKVAPRVTVPTAPCEVDPEACGSARELPGTTLQLVVVATSQGDFYHESVVLHDAKAGLFMSLADPRKTSRTADPETVPPVELSQLWVAPSGSAYAYDDRVVHLQTGPLHVAESGAGVACGFTTGGERVTALGG
jgi:hypothetical protein